VGNAIKIAAYVADWGFNEDITAADAAKLTHINYSFGLVEDGSVSIKHLKNVPRLLSAREQFPRVKINLSVGGWTAGGFSEAVATEEGREKLARSAVALLDALPLDGIDWDWEYPGSGEAGIAFSEDDPEKATLLLVRTRALLDARGAKDGKYYEQSIAVGASRTGDYIWKDVLPALDSVNLMTYDMAMPGKAALHTNLYPSPNAHYSALQSVNDFHNAGIPEDKLFIGAAFYFHRYLGVKAEGMEAADMDKRGEGYSYREFKAKEGEFARYIDEAAAASVYRRGEEYLSGDDVDSLRAKGKHVRDKKLGGVIIWEYNHDHNGELLSALYDGIYG
jgi:chitinase